MNEEHERLVMGVITDLLDLSWVQKAMREPVCGHCEKTRSEHYDQSRIWLENESCPVTRAIQIMRKIAEESEPVVKSQEVV